MRLVRILSSSTWRTSDLSPRVTRETEHSHTGSSMKYRVVNCIPIKSLLNYIENKNEKSRLKEIGFFGTIFKKQYFQYLSIVCCSFSHLFIITGR